MHSLGEESCIGWIPIRVTSKMAPHRGNWSQLSVRQVRRLYGVFGNTEVAIGFARHDQCLGFDRTQRSHQVSSIHLVRTDVRILPAPELRQKVVRIVLQKIGFPETL